MRAEHDYEVNLKSELEMQKEQLQLLTSLIEKKSLAP